jgi:hypothetical protein
MTGCEPEEPNRRCVDRRAFRDDTEMGPRRMMSTEPDNLCAVFRKTSHTLQ